MPPSALAAAKNFVFVANAHRERHIVQRWLAPADGTEAVPAELINRATRFIGMERTSHAFQYTKLMRIRRFLNGWPAIAP